MTPTQSAYLFALLHRFFADRPKQEPAEWCCENLIFNEPDNRGPFTLSGFEYLREILNAWGEPTITDLVFVKGSQLGGTASIMGGAAWTLKNEPSRIKWVMPTRDLVTGFSRKRWMPLCHRSAQLAEMIPGGAKRHDFSTLSQIMGGSIIDFAWSNSPSALSSDPCRIVILDEVDKFNEGGNREADAVNLAEQRTKRFANPKRIKTSTPTLVTGLIWQEFQKTDQRRRFMPCPHCRKCVTLIWSKNYTVFKLTGEEACVRWDTEAKKPDGSWDMDRVEASARFECPHCAGHIRDAHKTVMDRDGVWRPTTPAAGGYRGWHLSSLYAASAQTNVGKLAVKFLQDKASLLGLQGFINGTLAEPYQAQDTLSERVELVTSKIEVTAEWRKLLTVDCQAKKPSFWYVVRAWNGGDSEGLDAGSCDQWSDLEAIQAKHKIESVHVGVDSGFGAKSDAEVYKECALEPRSSIEHWDTKSVLVGWRPMKGMPGRKRWKDEESGAMQPWNLGKIDPFAGTAYAGQVLSFLLQFSGDYFKDILQALRQGKGGHKWSVSQEMAREEYWRHLDGEVKKPFHNKRTGFISHEWQMRSKHWPNHLLDCEVEQIAMAVFHKFFALPTG